jgi:hypothetical protein
MENKYVEVEKTAGITQANRITESYGERQRNLTRPYLLIINRIEIRIFS